MGKTQIFFFVWTLIFFLASGANAQPKSRATESPAIALTNPNIILFNANVITMDEQMPSAQAIAIEGNRISAGGTNDVVLALQTSGTQLIDLEGRTVVPRLIEAHNHRLLHAFWDDGPDAAGRGDACWEPQGRLRSTGIGEWCVRL